MDAQTLIAQWGAVVARFNEGDNGPLFDMLADDCVFNTSFGPVGSTKAEIMTNIQAARDDGWTAHFPLGLTAAGDFLAGVYRNDAADGSSYIAAGIMRIDEDGKIVELRSIEPADYVAKMTAAAGG
jgi:hypothetical protein